MKSEIFEIVAKVLNVPKANVHEGLTPIEIETWDSVRHMTLLMATEEHFNCVFSDRDMVSVGSVGDLISLVEKRQKR